MASLDISPEIGRSYQKLVTGPALNKPSPTYAQWAVFSVSAPLQNAFVQSSAKASTLKVHASGEGELEDLIEEFNDGKVQFAFVKVKDPNSGLPKFVLICWCGEGVPERVKGYFTGHLNAVTKVLHGYHVQVTARSDSDLSPEAIIQKVADASGSKYSAGSSSVPQSSAAPKPPVATKPVFQPTRVTGGSLPIAPRAPFRRDPSEDKDGWGADAPPVTRTQLEKVAPAYKPTKVDINELRSQPTSTTSGYSKSSGDEDVVKGGYQPIGKVDIAALRRGYKEERPEPVKGSYKPVDVGSIRKAPVARPEPEPAAPASVSERSSAFSQSERLTSLPKPKVAKKFGPGAPSFGTKPLTPGGFGAPVAPPAVQIGSISKTGSTKSPAQIWAEKKARERGLSGASETTPPTVSPAATGQRVSPSYTGASASSQHHEEDVSSSAAGVSALRNRFSGAAPMGAPSYSSPQHTGDRAPPPPAPDVSTRPSFGAPMQVLPPRPSHHEEAPPTISARSIPSPPPQPRSPSPPTPEIPGTPVRIAMPVAREDPEELVTKPQEPAVPVPTASLSRAVPREEELADEAPATAPGASGTGQRAIVLYDYTADEDNEINLVEGQVVIDIDMVDEDWWRGTNALGQEGLFPSNYVELIEGGAEEPAVAQRSPSPPPAQEPETETGPSAVALYDYEATEDNELSFPDGAIIEDIQFPDDDWWHGTYKGRGGLFPANYVELQQ